LFKQACGILVSQGVLVSEEKDEPVLESSWVDIEEWDGLFDTPSEKPPPEAWEAFERLELTVVGKVANTLWGMRMDTTGQAYFYSHLWPHLDRQIVSIAFKMVGKNASLRTYSQVYDNREVLEEIAREASHLLPLVDVYVPVWLDHKATLTRSILGQVKKQYREWGLTDAGWRAVTRLSAGSVFMWRTLGQIRGIAIMNLIGRLGTVTVPTAVLKWMRRSDLLKLLLRYPDQDQMRSPAPKGRFGVAESERIMRIILEQAVIAKRRRRLNRFITQELMLVEDALVSSVETLTLPREFDWKWLMRFQVEWHDAEVDKIELPENICWQSLLGETKHGAHRVVPLTDAVQLVQEGKDMRHCVWKPIYAKRCASGESRIFSVRKKGFARPVATIELRCFRTEGRASDHWGVRQIQGFHNNEPITPTVMRIAKTLCRRYNTLAQVQPPSQPVQQPDLELQEDNPIFRWEGLPAGVAGDPAALDGIF